MYSECVCTAVFVYLCQSAFTFDRKRKFNFFRYVIISACNVVFLFSHILRACFESILIWIKLTQFGLSGFSCTKIVAEIFRERNRISQIIRAAVAFSKILVCLFP